MSYKKIKNMTAAILLDVLSSHSPVRRGWILLRRHR